MEAHVIENTEQFGRLWVSNLLIYVEYMFKNRRVEAGLEHLVLVVSLSSSLETSRETAGDGVGWVVGVDELLIYVSTQFNVFIGLVKAMIASSRDFWAMTIAR